MQLSVPHELAETLTERIAAYSDAIMAADAALVERFLDANFTTVFLHPTYRVTDRNHWLTLVPDFRVEQFEVLHELLSIDGDIAVHYRLANMTASVLGSTRNGLFVIADHWRLRSAGGWLLWQRLSVPFAAADLPV